MKILLAIKTVVSEWLKLKNFSEEKTCENVWAEILDSCLQEALAFYDVKQVHEVDTTNKKTDEVVKEVLEVIGGKRKPEVGIFNWLKKLI